MCNHRAKTEGGACPAPGPLDGMAKRQIGLWAAVLRSFVSGLGGYEFVLHYQAPRIFFMPAWIFVPRAFVSFVSGITCNTSSACWHIIFCRVG